MSVAQTWQDILDAPHDALILGEAALVLAKDEYPDLDLPQYLEQLDGMAATIKNRMRADISPADKLALLNHYMFEESGFAGNADDYYDPRNSYLNDVIERKLGIPITLSVLYMEIGRRLGLSLAGVSFPGHFLVKCALRDGAVIIDAYARGASLGIKDLQQRLRALWGGTDVAPEAVMRMLAAAGPREILARMIRNLRAIYIENGDKHRALTLANRVIDLCPDAAVEYRERARLLDDLECCRAALADFETYLKLDPQAHDVRAVHGKIAALRERVWRLN